jgi:hypothetical protein
VLESIVNDVLLINRIVSTKGYKHNVIKGILRGWDYESVKCDISVLKKNKKVVRLLEINFLLAYNRHNMILRQFCLQRSLSIYGTADSCHYNTYPFKKAQTLCSLNLKQQSLILIINKLKIWEIL